MRRIHVLLQAPACNNAKSHRSFPITQNGKARKFYIHDIELPCESTAKILTWGDIVLKFSNKFALEVQRESTSQHLQSVQLQHFESAHGGTTAKLEKLIASIDKVAPMAKKRDRTDEARAGFLQSAVMPRKCGVNAMASLKGRQYGYQDLIDALFSGIADEATCEKSLAHEEASCHNGATGYRKSRWKTSHIDLKEEFFCQPSQVGRRSYYYTTWGFFIAVLP